MKLSILIVTTVLAVTSLAATRPEPTTKREGSRRGVELSGKLMEKAESLSIKAREILGEKYLGENFNLEVPKGLTRSEMNKYERKFEEMEKTLESTKTELVKDANKSAEVANLILTMNSLFKTRPRVKSFAERNKLESVEKEAVETTLEFIDNASVMIEAMALSSFEAPVSPGQILRTFTLINSLKSSGLKAQDFIDLEAQITGLLPKNYNMRKAARCTK